MLNLKKSVVLLLVKLFVYMIDTTLKSSVYMIDITFKSFVYMFDIF